MNSWLRAILCGTALAAGADSLQAQTLDLRRMEVVTDSLAHEFLHARVTPGISVAVARNGEIIFTRAHGLSDVVAGTVVTPATVFPIASVSKQFTAATVMRLVEQGQISLEEPITRVLPDFPVQGRTVTTHHLLSHTSGISDYALHYEPRPDWFAHNLSFREMVEMWGGAPFDFEPGTKYDYNNMGYYLLAEIVSRTTGTAFEDYLDLEVLRPLGLTHTANCETGRASRIRATGYIGQNEVDWLTENTHLEFDPAEVAAGRVRVPYRNLRLFRGGGGLCSTVGDLARWAHLLHSGRVVGRAAIERMVTPTVLTTGDTVPRGYGLYLDDLAGHQKIYHGGTFGFGPVLSYYPEIGLSIAVLTNSTRGRDAAEAIEEALARIALDIELRDLPLNVQEKHRYEGVFTYLSGAGTRELRLFGEGERLMARIGEDDPFRLRYQGDDIFLHEADDDVRLVFDEEGAQADSVTIHWGRRTFRGQRQ